jgi:hypothetical protein
VNAKKPTYKNIVESGVKHQNQSLHLPMDIVRNQKYNIPQNQGQQVVWVWYWKAGVFLNGVLSYQVTSRST